MKKKTFLACLLLTTALIRGQDFTARVLDSLTQKPIPFASITISNKTGVISNEEGRFRLRYSPPIKDTDTLIISSMGYEAYRKALRNNTDSLVYLAPKPIALNSVIVYNKQMDVETIMEKTLSALEEKYDFKTTKKQLFLRQSEKQEFLRMKTELSKSSIPEFNQRFFDSILNNIPKKNASYLETLTDLYGDYTKERQKIDIIKAVEMIDENNEISFETFEKRFNSILNKRIKKDSYFKIKSGWFGGKVEAKDFFDMEQNGDSTQMENLVQKKIKEQKNDSIRKQNFTANRKEVLGETYSSLFEEQEWKISILEKANRYKFELLEYNFIGDTPVYVVSFSPLRRGKFKGTLYIDADRMALLRMDYQNTERLRNFKLLGIYFRHPYRNGKVIFKLQENDKYTLHYFEQINRFEMGVDRPLKIIEKNKNVRGRRKQNELSMDLNLDMAQEQKLEIFVFDTKPITDEAYQQFKENNEKLPERIFKYDPNLWKDYNIMEPNESIKKLKVVPESEKE